MSDFISMVSSASIETIVADKLQNINNKLGSLPSVLDKSTLQKLADGEYDISLKEYTNLTTYKAQMTALYGNSSANQFNSSINKILGNQTDEITTLKDFMDKMSEQGLSNSDALKMYSALKKYSIVTNLNNYNFVNAKI